MSALRSIGTLATHKVHHKLLSDWADAQADWVFAGSTRQIVGFVVPRHNYIDATLPYYSNKCPSHTFLWGKKEIKCHQYWLKDIKISFTYPNFVSRTSFEPPHDKTNKMACAPSEDSDQPGHSPCLIWVFTVRLKKARVLSYPLSDWADALSWGSSFGPLADKRDLITFCNMLCDTHWKSAKNGIFFTIIQSGFIYVWCIVAYLIY